jgi:hypothetical protein
VQDLHPLFKIGVSIVIFIFAVIQPLRANLTSAIVTRNKVRLDPNSQAAILEDAILNDLCETNILNALGEAYVLAKNPIMAAISFGKAVHCSPATSVFRFKYGEALLLAGIDGRFSLKEAITLERNNPLFNQELDRVTKALQSQLQ